MPETLKVIREGRRRLCDGEVSDRAGGGKEDSEPQV